jgi:hypothetical protein
MRIVFRALGASRSCGDAQPRHRFLKLASAHLILDGSVFITDAALAEVMRLVVAAELHLFYVDPSVGAEIAVLARAVRSTPSVVPTEAEWSEA